MGSESKTIVLIHGQWLNPRSWEFFQQYYEERGQRVLAPAWPRLQGEVEEVRQDPSALAGLGIGEIAAHYENIVRCLDTPAILMGHSLGGLVVQMLLDRGLGEAGVAIGSVAPRGAWRLPISTIKAVSPVLFHKANYRRTVGLTFEQFRYAFANTMAESEARSAYERYAIPGPGRTVFQAALANFNPWAVSKVHFRNHNRAPLLLVAGSDDHLTPAALIRSNWKQYADSQAITDFQEFPQRSHLIVAQTGWQEVAEYAFSWAKMIASDPTTSWLTRGGKAHAAATPVSATKPSDA